MAARKQQHGQRFGRPQGYTLVLRDSGVGGDRYIGCLHRGLQRRCTKLRHSPWLHIQPSKQLRIKRMAAGITTALQSAWPRRTRGRWSCAPATRTGTAARREVEMKKEKKKKRGDGTWHGLAWSHGVHNLGASSAWTSHLGANAWCAQQPATHQAALLCAHRQVEVVVAARQHLWVVLCVWVQACTEIGTR